MKKIANKTNVLGLIAGQGRLPFIVADGAHKAGLRVVCVGLSGNVLPDLKNKVDEFFTVPDEAAQGGPAPVQVGFEAFEIDRTPGPPLPL